MAGGALIQATYRPEIGVSGTFRWSGTGRRHVTQLLMLLAAGVFAVCAVGAILGRLPAGRLAPGRLGRAAERSLPARDGLVDALGAPTASAVVLLTGIAATVALCWPLGVAAHRLERSVDVPIFDWTTRNQHHGWTQINKVLTLMGNRPEVKVVCLVSAVILALLWRRRGWWLPPVAIAVAFGTEKYGQKLLGLVVHRGHPPTTRGTYPSGGVARLVAIYGVILFLVLLTYPAIGRRWRSAAWTAFGVAAFVEGYTRIYLLKHWFTDVVGGWIYGSLLLFALISATATLNRRPAGSRSAIGSGGSGSSSDSKRAIRHTV